MEFISINNFSVFSNINSQSSSINFIFHVGASTVGVKTRIVLILSGVNAESVSAEADIFNFISSANDFFSLERKSLFMQEIMLTDTLIDSRKNILCSPVKTNIIFLI